MFDWCALIRISMDSKLSPAHREGRLLDDRLVDREWRKDR